MARLKLADDIQPLTAFRNQSSKFASRMEKTKRPLVLTVNGRPKYVMMRVEEYDRQQDLLAQVNEEEAYRLALEDVQAGRVRAAGAVFADMRKKYGIPD